MAYKDKEKQKRFQREWKRKINLRNKLLAIKILGGVCNQKDCEITDYRCLHIDHKKPKLGKSGDSGINNANMVVRGLLTERHVQLLCANHHAIKTYEKDRFLYSNYIS